MLFSEVGGALISYLIWACKLSSHLLPLTSHLYNSLSQFFCKSTNNRAKNNKKILKICQIIPLF